MSNPNIVEAYVDSFQDELRHVAQQRASKLLPFVDSTSAEAQTGSWDVLGSADAAAKTRDAATPEADRDFYRRVAIATTVNDGEGFELDDPIQMLSDPKSKLLQSIGYSMGRAIDDKIIAAATGAATETQRTFGSADNNPTTSAFPSAQEVGGAYAAGISYDLITEALEVFDTNDIPEELPKIVVIGPRQCREILNLTEATSADFVQAQALQQSGIVTNWMGCTWVKSTRLLSPGAGQRDCLMMTPMALGYHMPGDIRFECSKDPSKQYKWRPYAELTAGAVRIEDAHIVRIKVADATAT